MGSLLRPRPQWAEPQATATPSPRRAVKAASEAFRSSCDTKAQAVMREGFGFFSFWVLGLCCDVSSLG